MSKASLQAYIENRNKESACNIAQQSNNVLRSQR